mgnify:CR=1 FL=1
MGDYVLRGWFDLGKINACRRMIECDKTQKNEHVLIYRSIAITNAGCLNIRSSTMRVLMPKILKTAQYNDRSGQILLRGLWAYPFIWGRHDWAEGRKASWHIH